MNSTKNILDLQDELKQMPEFKTLERIRHFNFSIVIFTGNYHQIQELLEFHNDPVKSQNMYSVNNRDVLQAFHTEIIRLLHNYLASAFSLIDHTRKHYNKLYKENGKFLDYQLEIQNRFINDPLSNFIKDLRQFVQHYKLPEIYTNTIFKQDPPELRRVLKLKKEDLMEFPWSSKSKIFLSHQTADLDLMQIVNEYFERVTEFYKWFQEKQAEIHKDEISIVDYKRAENKLKLIPDLLKASLSFPNNTISNFEAGIVWVFSSTEQEDLNSFTNNGKLRLSKIMEILNKHTVLTEDIQVKIKKLYSNTRN